MNGSAIKDFSISISQNKLDDIRQRLENGWISYHPADDADWHYGTDARYLAEFRDYWLNHYDWRAAERRLNAFPQFIANVDGLDIHFYHVRGSARKAHPVILTHGWPGSVVEFLGVIDRLANPGRYGGDPEDGLDVVVPSLPGYGFSARPANPMGPRAVAALWRKLMVDVLGYQRFGAQGGDWGSRISIALAHDHGDVVSSIHLNLLFRLQVADDSDAYRQWTAAMADIMDRESAYMHMQATKPQTLALALGDSPLGFTAWILEKYHGWMDIRGGLERTLTKDDLITNIMTYLVNDAVASSIWLYHAARNEALPKARLEVPTGFAFFPEDFVPLPPFSAAQKAFNIVRWTVMQNGGHFAAWEEPEAFSADVLSFFREHR